MKARSDVALQSMDVASGTEAHCIANLPQRDTFHLSGAYGDDGVYLDVRMTFTSACARRAADLGAPNWGAPLPPVFVTADYKGLKG